MYFDNRVALGEDLASKLQDFHKKDAIILCLREEALLTCLSMAMHLRAWVYPVLYEPVYDLEHGAAIVGAINEAGDFVLHPSLFHADDTVQAHARSIAKDTTERAVSSIREHAKLYDMELHSNRLVGRHIIIGSDVLTSPIALAVVEKILPRTSIKQLAVAIGNASSPVAEMAHVSAPTVIILDVVPDITANQNSYFKHDDEYTIEEKRKLTKNITAYWQ